jgi:hypothetical protein
MTKGTNMTPIRILLFSLCLLIPACANMGGQLQEKLDRITAELSATQVKLGQVDARPEVKELVSGLEHTLTGLSGTINAIKSETDKVDGIKEKIGAGLQVAGDLVPGPYGSLAKMIGGILVGAGAHTLVNSRGKEKSFNAGMKKMARIITPNGNGGAA